jgi:hypothetical protein
MAALVVPRRETFLEEMHIAPTVFAACLAVSMLLWAAILWAALRVF